MSDDGFLDSLAGKVIIKNFQECIDRDIVDQLIESCNKPKPSTPPLKSRPTSQDHFDCAMKLQMINMSHFIWWGRNYDIKTAKDGVERCNPH